MSPVHPAPVQLAELISVMRPDWDMRQAEGAIAHARSSCGWLWPRVFIETCRLLVQEESSPRDLTVAAEASARDPRRGGAPADPDMARSWAADIRENLALRRAS